MAEEKKQGLIYSLKVKALNKWNASFNKATKSVDKLTGRFKKFKLANKLIKTVMNRVVGLTAVLGAATTAIYTVGRGLLDGAKSAEDLEAAYANINTLIAGPGGLEESSKKFIVEMSKAYGQSAQANAKAYYDIISAGITDQAEANKILEQSNKLALTGVADITSTTKTLTGVVNAYGAENLSAARAADILQTAVESGVVTMPELSQGLGQLTAMAGPLGISLEEVVALVAELTSKGTPAAQAMTMVKGILGSIVKKEGKDAIPVLEKIGFQWDANTVRAKGLIGMLTEASKKIGKNTELWNRLIPEVEAGGGAMAATSNDAKGLNEKHNNLINSTGKLTEAIKDQEKTFKNQYNRALRDMEEAQRKAGVGINDLRLKWVKLKTVVFKTIPVIKKFFTEDFKKMFRWPLHTMSVWVSVFKDLFGWLGKIPGIGTGLKKFFAEIAASSKKTIDMVKKAISEPIGDGADADKKEDTGAVLGPPKNIKRMGNSAGAAASSLTTLKTAAQKAAEETKKGSKLSKEEREKERQAKREEREREKRAKKEEREAEKKAKKEERERAKKEKKELKANKVLATAQKITIDTSGEGFGSGWYEERGQFTVKGGRERGWKTGRNQAQGFGKPTGAPTSEDVGNAMDKPAMLVATIKPQDMNKFFTKLKPELGKLAQKKQIDTLISELKELQTIQKATQIATATTTESNEKKNFRKATWDSGINAYVIGQPRGPGPAPGP